MKIKSRLDDNTIDIDIFPNKNYSIMLSGGLDSAILLYFMIKSHLEIGQIPNIQSFTIPKHDGAALYIDKIINFFNDYFKINLANTIHVGDPNIYHGNQSAVAIKEIFTNYPKIDYIYLATNQNPPANFKLPGEYPNRVKQSNNPKIVLPFIKLFKTHIIDLIYQYNVQELIDITHSCTEQKVGRCNQCFQCHERIWAFNELNQKDTGTL